MSQFSFLRREDGGMTLEAVIILPLLFWCLIATYVFYDAYAERNSLTKANYTVADLLSRETRPIDTPYLAGAADVLEHLSGNGRNSRIRVTVVRCVADCLDEDMRQLGLDWSEGVGMEALTEEQINEPAIEAGVPIMALGARAVVVQSMVDYVPLFEVGLPSMPLMETAVVRPRFAPQLCWETCDSNEDEDEGDST